MAVYKLKAKGNIWRYA